MDINMTIKSLLLAAILVLPGCAVLPDVHDLAAVAAVERRVAQLQNDTVSEWIALHPEWADEYEATRTAQSPSLSPSFTPLTPSEQLDLPDGLVVMPVSDELDDAEDPEEVAE